MGEFKSNLVTAASVIALLLFFEKGQCDSICPNGITNITASSGRLVYPESGTYGKNETKCWSITVPDTYYKIMYRFSRFDVEMCSDCKCDYFQIERSSYYNYLHWAKKKCGRSSYNYLQGYLFNVDRKYDSVSGSTLYIRFVSDDTVHHTGFDLTFIARSIEVGEKNYLNATEDETIEFGTPKVDIKNYPSSYAEQWFLIVPEGRKVQIDFDIFELEDSEDCENDYVEFREASIEVDDPKKITGRPGPILTSRLCGSTKPNSILSQGNMVWVQFMSDGNSTTVYKGFKASFKAGQGRVSVSRPVMLPFLSAMIMHLSKISLL